MSSGASSQSICRPPIGREGFTNDLKDHPPTYNPVKSFFAGQSRIAGLLV